jgi:hypothetical protein
MSTHATVKITEDKTTLCTLFVHWDGYWEGLGKNIVNILSDGQLVNGLGMERKLGSQFNGAGCLAATLIAKLKTEPGDVYLTTEGTQDDMNHYDLKISDYLIELYHNGERKWFNTNVSVPRS